MHRNLYPGILIAAICLLSLQQFAVKAADNTASVSSEQALSQLEDRFFEHQYDNDSDVDRLNRLEQFIYGSTETGSVATRLKNIQSTIPDETTNQASNNTNVSQNNSDTDSEQDTSNQATQQADASARSTFDYSSYPRVTILEQELLGQTYANEALSQRLSRMETKAFGKASASTDLSQRVDSLDAYAEKHDLYGEHTPSNNIASSRSYLPLSRPPASGGTQSSQSIPSPSNQNANFVGSVEEHVAMMEAQEFDHTYPDHPLDKRLKKLEKRILPNQDNSNLGLTDRANKLWFTLHPGDKSTPLIASSDTANNTSQTMGTSQAPDNQQANQPRRSWLHKLANGAAAGMSNPAYGYPGSINSSSSYGMPLAPGVPYNLATPAGSRFIGGATFGPGAGPAGIPFSVW